MRPWRLLMCTARALALIALSSCVFPVPPSEHGRDNVLDAVPEFIVVGKTTREDVLFALGEPDGESDFQRRFLYYRVSGHGGVGFLFAAGSGGMVGTSEQVTYHRLVVLFDAAGVVADARFMTDTCQSATFGIGGAVGESPPCVDVSPHGALAENPLVADGARFPGLVWYKGRDILEPRGLAALFEDNPPRTGTLVLGGERMMFFTEGANSISRPLWSWSYPDLRDPRVDGDGKKRRLLLIGADGRLDSLKAPDPSVLATIAEQLSARREHKTPAPPAPAGVRSVPKGHMNGRR